MTTLENFTPGLLPVINATCQECGLIEVIDETVEWDQQQTAISPGSLTASLVMNFLTKGQPMYRLSDFFDNKYPENLFGDGIPAEDLYDRRFGWALDTVADAGPRRVLNSVVSKAITTEGVDIGVVHTDASPNQSTVSTNMRANTKVSPSRKDTAATATAISSSSTSASV